MEIKGTFKPVDTVQACDEMNTLNVTVLLHRGKIWDERVRSLSLPPYIHVVGFNFLKERRNKLFTLWGDRICASVIAREVDRCSQKLFLPL